MRACAWRLRFATHLIRLGGVIAYPTESVYGLGCDPVNDLAVARLLNLKNRPAHKGLILIGSKIDQLLPYLKPLKSEIKQRVQRSWPGPVTWVLPAQDWVPGWLRGEHATLAVRVTGHPVARALCDFYGGALVSSSANPAGAPPARTPLTVRRYFGEQVDLILHGEVNRRGRPTEIRDALSDRVIRPA